MYGKIKDYLQSELKSIEDNGLDAYLHATAMWWHEWLAPARTASAKLNTGHVSGLKRGMRDIAATYRVAEKGSRYTAAPCSPAMRLALYMKRGGG